MRRLAIAVLLLVIASANAAVSGALRYSIADLNVPISHWYDQVYAFDLNNSGQAVGFTRDASANSEQGWWYKNGTTQVLETLGSSCEARSINDTGTIAGSCITSTYWQPCVWENGELRQLQRPGNFSECLTISSSGLVGGYYGWNGGYLPCTWDSSGFHGVGGVTGWIGDIADDGRMVGTTMDGNPAKAFQITNGNIEFLPSLGGTSSSAGDMNKAGKVVGFSATADGAMHACLWTNKIAQDLGAPPGQWSSASDINEAGVVVGNSMTSQYLPSGALLWSDGQMYNLADLIPAGSGWTLTSATAINDSGQILGTGSHNGQHAAFLLTPVPEPSALLALVVGLAGLPLVRRRHK